MIDLGSRAIKLTEPENIENVDLGRRVAAARSIFGNTI